MKSWATILTKGILHQDCTSLWPSQVDDFLIRHCYLQVLSESRIRNNYFVDAGRPPDFSFPAETKDDGVRRSPTREVHNDLDEVLAKLQQILANNFSLDGECFY